MARHSVASIVTGCLARPAPRCRSDSLSPRSPRPSRNCRGCAARSAAAPRLLVKRDDAAVRVRRQQGPQDAAGGGRGAVARRRRHADHEPAACSRTMRASRPPPRRGSACGCMLVVNGASAQRNGANAQRAARSPARRRDPLRRRAARSARRPWKRPRPTSARAGRRPYVIPLGASTPLGAAAFVHAVAELLRADPAARRHRPRLVVGRHAGRARRRLRPRRRQDAGHRHQRRRAARGARRRDPAHPRRPRRPARATERERFDSADVDVDDDFVGDGYGVPTPASARRSSCWRGPKRSSSIPTYTAKAMAGLIAAFAPASSARTRRALLAHRRTGGLFA